MISINEITLLGRLGADSQNAATATGKPSVKMSICTNEKFTVNGETKETSDWHDAIAFGNVATMLQRFNMKKGDEILVKGKLKHYAKDYRDGAVTRKMWKTYVQITDARIFGRASAPQQTQTQTQTTAEEDLPF